MTKEFLQDNSIGGFLHGVIEQDPDLDSDEIELLMKAILGASKATWKAFKATKYDLHYQFEDRLRNLIIQSGYAFSQLSVAKDILALRDDFILAGGAFKDWFTLCKNANKKAKSHQTWAGVYPQYEKVPELDSIILGPATFEHEWVGRYYLDFSIQFHTAAMLVRSRVKFLRPTYLHVVDLGEGMLVSRDFINEIILNHRN